MLSTYKTGLLQAKAYRILKNYLSRNLDEYNLTMPEWALLGSIYEKESMKLTEIAKLLDVEAPYATNLAEQLQKKGLVIRAESSDDRRVKRISLTKKGALLVPVVERNIKNAMRTIYNSVTQDELGVYIKVLQAITIEYSK
ncbi:MAG: MarR family transcriptional regulator [bacterium]|nr:MarR family transcriptional regulator [bacterium]